MPQWPFLNKPVLRNGRFSMDCPFSIGHVVLCQPVGTCHCVDIKRDDGGGRLRFVGLWLRILTGFVVC